MHGGSCRLLGRERPSRVTLSETAPWGSTARSLSPPPGSLDSTSSGSLPPFRAQTSLHEEKAPKLIFSARPQRAGAQDLRRFKASGKKVTSF